jgi:hypothetical protein
MSEDLSDCDDDDELNNDVDDERQADDHQRCPAASCCSSITIKCGINHASHPLRMLAA